MKSKNNTAILYVINLIIAIVSIFSCAVYSKLTDEDSTGFVFLGIALLAYAILLFVANNMKKKTFATVLKIVLSSTLMAGLFIFFVVTISIFAGGQDFDLFEMLYALFGLIAFAFSVLNFVYCLINLRNNASESYYKLFNMCLFASLAAIFLTFTAQGIYLSVTKSLLLVFHGIITLAELLFTFFLVNLTCKNKGQDQEVVKQEVELPHIEEVATEPQEEKPQE